MIKVVVCSNQPVVVEGFRDILGGAPEFVFNRCGVAPDLAGHLNALSAGILLIDLNPDITLDFIEKIRTEASRVRTILWTHQPSPEFLSQAMCLGVRGVLRRTASVEQHLDCISRVAAGTVWVDSELTGDLLTVQKVNLSPRERELVGLVARGLRNKEIAFSMGISEGTVKIYMSRVFQKTRTSDRLELALLALKNIGTDEQSAGYRSPVRDGDRSVGYAIPRVLNWVPGYAQAA